ncbi:Zn(2)-C6 fungal-type domain-containing protein [Pleurotus pulmonarius]
MSSTQTGNNRPHQDDVDTPRVPRRTPMACQFCRGRKLKCDGVRPTCGNCNRRGFPCNYTPVNSAEK